MICEHCGTVNEEKAENPRRSAPQHKRMFALFRAAYSHWGHSHEFRPKNKDHLRYWLEMKAGHFDVVYTVRVKSVSPERLESVLTAVLRASKDDSMFVELDCDLLTVRRTKSIAYHELPHKEACQLFEAVEEVLYAEGLDPDQLLKETANAA